MTETPTSSHAAPTGAPSRTTVSAPPAVPSAVNGAPSPHAPAVENETPRYRQSCLWARWRLRLTMLGMLILPFFAWRFASAEWLRWSFPLGAIISALGVSVRLWAAGWLHKHEALATDGPYSWVRHPLYAGTGLAALGQGLMSGIPLAAIGFPLFWLVLYRQAIREEETFLCAKYPGAYEEFRRQVPALTPRLGRKTLGPSGSFSWSQAWRNREYEGVLLNVIAIAVYGWLHFGRG